jgi:hypothetical protein
VHRELGFAAILTYDGQSPQMRAAQFFPPMEMAMLLQEQHRGILSRHGTGYCVRRNAGSGI